PPDDGVDLFDSLQHTLDEVFRKPGVALRKVVLFQTIRQRPIRVGTPDVHLKQGPHGNLTRHSSAHLSKTYPLVRSTSSGAARRSCLLATPKSLAAAPAGDHAPPPRRSLIQPRADD